MVHHCCVPLCTNDSRLKKCVGISYHRFPNDPKLAKTWIIKIRRDVGKDFTLSKETVVCSEHFTVDDYRISSSKEASDENLVPAKARKLLVKGAVPSIFAWTVKRNERRNLPSHHEAIDLEAVNEEVENTLNVQHMEIQGIQQLTNVYVIPGEQSSEASTSTAKQSEFTLRHPSDTSSSEISLESVASPDKCEIKNQNLLLLELRSKEKFALSRFVDSNESIKYYTGFQTYACFYSFYQFLTPACFHLQYIRGHSDFTKETVQTPKLRTRTLSPIEEFFLVTTRLRKGLGEKVLADLYGLSESQISRICNTWILFLSNRVSFLPIWPSKEHTAATIPECFKNKYANVRLIIDCTEIFLEHPSSSFAQKESFSSYKHHNTVKGLVGITPSGHISYFSSLYAGRCSDKKIVFHCGVIDLLEEGDVLMADRGFDIAKYCEERKIELVIPAFLGKSSQFSPKQLKESRDIANVRIHVERAIRRIKEFNILSGTVPITLTPMLNHIWIVCCHLSNFTGSLYK